MSKYLIVTQEVLTRHYTFEVDSPSKAEEAFRAYFEGAPAEDIGFVGYNENHGDEMLVGIIPDGVTKW